RQESTLFNVIQMNAARKFRLTRGWNWYADLIFQQATANAPVNLPLVITRNRIAYEGTHFKQLNLSTGLEIRYVSPFKADGYSPVLGQFFFQNDTVINNLPDISAYLHFRIRSWYLFARAENLNAVSFAPQFGFFENNFAAPLYPMPGLLFRIGIYWGMVN
ncbi:MAG: putative porin, partial [Bacteroidota bacterium]